MLDAPSAPTIRSAQARSATGGPSNENRSSTSSDIARSWRIASSSRRPSAANPWPPERVTVSRWWMSISVQRAKRPAIASYDSGSACSNTVSVSSLKTTPKPNASEARLRSNTVTAQSGRSLRIRIEK